MTRQIREIIIEFLALTHLPSSVLPNQLIQGSGVGREKCLHNMKLPELVAVTLVQLQEPLLILKQSKSCVCILYMRRCTSCRTWSMVKVVWPWILRKTLEYRLVTLECIIINHSVLIHFDMRGVGLLVL